MAAAHTSVLLGEALEWLAPSSGKTIVDGTVGFGGHAGRILERLGPKGKLIGFDRDSRALEAAGERLKDFGDRLMLVHDDFRNVPERLKAAGIDAVDGVLLDLGVSSMQLDEADRGFSFAKDGPLDMRMNPDDVLTAKTIVNQYPKRDLEQIFWRLGEERYGRRIAERIERERSRRRIETTGELAAIIFQAVPAAYRHGRIHPATRSFQALRIAVNGELESLEIFLSQVTDYIKEDGRIVIISFHSLEDRLVKQAFRRFQTAGLGKALTKKPVTPSEAEAAANPRSRSAKLRAFVKKREVSA